MKLRLWASFVALCLLSGSGWLLAEWQPPTLPGLAPVILRSGLLALTFAALDRATKSSRSATGQWSLFGCCLLLAGLPAVAVIRAAEHLSPLTETLVFTLAPVFVVFFLAQTEANFGEQETPLRLLPPTLVGVLGAALLLPFHIPPSTGGRVWLVLLLATAAASAWAAIQLHRHLNAVPILPAAALFSASIFLPSALLCLAEPAHFASWTASAIKAELLHSLLLDGPITLLSVWLLRELPPVAFSSRYPLVIAITIAEGYLLLRPQTTSTTGLGLLLLLCSGTYLLLADSPEVS